MKSISIMLRGIVVLILLSGRSGASILHVPGDYPTIQQAIHAAENGDTVLVDAGEYFENINFRGKPITVAGKYLMTLNPADILSTVINGSSPVNPDTASCVLFINGEDSTSVLTGFTITGGQGTRWLDEHGAGYYREGGGILVQYASPTVTANLIAFNEATDKTNCSSAGGGGIRCGDSDPHIYNNVIQNNQGRYGAGLVLNYCGGHIRNNIFANNFGGEDYGGGGLWINGNFAQHPILIENNAIVNNHSELQGGGIRFWSSTAQVTNNIIWGNTAGSNPQIQGGYISTITYCDIEGGWAGEGNIDADPLFYNPNFLLGAGSLCIDAGNPSIAFNDPEDPGNPGNAAWPSLGTVRNDMGAYGGPCRMVLADIQVYREENPMDGPPLIRLYPNPASSAVNISFPEPVSPGTVFIHNANGTIQYTWMAVPGTKTLSLDVSRLPEGVYLITMPENGLHPKKFIIHR
jgi:hypothetical protein